MYYGTVYIGMDVHKENFSLCCYTNEKEQAEYHQKVEAHYSKIINYLEAISPLDNGHFISVFSEQFSGTRIENCLIIWTTYKR